MNIKKSKITLLLGASLFLTVPLVSTFADQQHHEMHDMNMGKSMQNIKDELRGYVEGVKSDDTKKMQQHISTLLKLSDMSGMNHADMDHSDMPKDMMATMEHSDMDRSDMPMDHTEMAKDMMVTMDHSDVDHSDMPMDHTEMTKDMMATMEHSDMDHSDMPMDHTEMTKDMSTMEGMSAEQHQHMMYMQEMTTFHGLFNSLDNAKDKAEITVILRKIKQQIKNTNG